MAYPFCKSVISQAISTPGKAFDCNGDATKLVTGRSDHLPTVMCGSESGVLSSVVVTHRSNDRDCVKNGILNLVSEHLSPVLIDMINKKVQVVTKGDKYTNLEAMSPVFSPFGIGLCKELGVPGLRERDTLQRLVELRDEPFHFVLTNNAHCIGVDCKRGLIFDCANEFAIALSMAGFHSCGFSSVLRIRRVIVDVNRIRKLVWQFRSASP